MADGDTIVKDDGSDGIGSDGSDMVQGSTGCGSCCMVQARLCSDGSLSGLWLPTSSISAFPYYALRTADGLNYVFSSTDSGAGGTAFGAYTVETSCPAGCCSTQTVIVTFGSDAVFASGIIIDSNGGTFDPYSSNSAVVVSGSIAGNTYCLRQTSPTSCYWVGSDPNFVINYWTNELAAGPPAAVYTTLYLGYQFNYPSVDQLNLDFDLVYPNHIGTKLLAYYAYADSMNICPGTRSFSMIPVGSPGGPSGNAPCLCMNGGTAYLTGTPC